jgi:hypothetical protein
LHEIWYRGNVTQGDLNAIISNPIASIISKLLKFELLGERYQTVGLDSLCTLVTMASKLFTAVHSVKLSQTELNEVKVNSLKLSSIKLGSSTSNK